MLKKIDRKVLLLIGSLFVFGLFFYISYKTPLAGDDWGYYLNSLNQNPIEGALGFYNSWSGRFFSEMWGFIMPKNKWLWNIVNPLLFTGIFICLNKLINSKKNSLITILLILAVMLSIDDNLRMETYTWIMGTTYIVPLFLSLVYFVSIEKLIVEDKENKIVLYLNNILLFVIGLMMENIAATMIGGIAILTIYCFVKKKNKALKYLIINLAVSIISFAIMRLSPGSTYRLLRDNAAWVELSVVEKIVNQYPNFIQLTFINNNYMIAILSIIVIGLCIFSFKKNTVYKVTSIVINTIAIATVFSFIIAKEGNILLDGNSIYSKVFWPIYIINLFITIFSCITDKEKRNKTIYMLIIAGASSLAMLLSPTFGSRSVIYTVYYIIIVIGLIFDEIELNKVSIVFAIVFIAIICDRTYEYLYKYRLVGLAQEERLEIIKYYQEHPEDEEAWIPRFPIYTVHGADIEIGDEYHFETFKDYYKLPQSKDKIIFYYLEDK